MFFFNGNSTNIKCELLDIHSTVVMNESTAGRGTYNAIIVTTVINECMSDY